MATQPKRRNRLSIPPSGTLENVRAFFYCSYPDCNYKSNWEENVGTHESSHNPTGISTIPCQVCPQVFGYLVSFFHHMVSKHSNKLFCPWCLFLGEDLSEFKAHILTHILKPSKSSENETANEKFEFRCVICSKTFTRKRDFGRHQKKKHNYSNSSNPVTVESNNDNDIKVQRTFLGCVKCSYKTLNASNLRSHSRTHSSEKPFKCPKFGCSFMTRWPKSLRNHYRWCRGGIQIPHDEAAVFGQKKSSEGTTEKVKALEGEALLKCTMCTFRSKWRSSLIRHRLLVHKDHRPFRCPRKDCKKRTKWSSNLRKHSRRRHSSKLPKVSLQTKGNLGMDRKCENGTGITVKSSSSDAFACMLCDFIGDSELSTLKHSCQHKTVVVSLNRIL